MFGISRGRGRIGIVLFSSQFCLYIKFHETVCTSVLLTCGMKLFVLQILAFWSPCLVNELLLLFMTSQLFLVMHFKLLDGLSMLSAHAWLFIIQSVRADYLNLYLFVDFLEMTLWSGISVSGFHHWRLCIVSLVHRGELAVYHRRIMEESCCEWCLKIGIRKRSCESRSTTD